MDSKTRTPHIPTSYEIKQHASKGRSKRQIAAQFNLYEHELEAMLKKNKDLQRAYDMGVVESETHIHDKLWENGDKGLLLLKARMKLKLEDPVLEELSGGLLKTILAKSDSKTKKTLSNLLGIK